jgi:hypothetical protein
MVGFGPKDLLFRNLRSFASLRMTAGDADVACAAAKP